MSREDPQFKLRLPADLKAKLDQRAKLNGRSINAELVQIVRSALSDPNTSSASEVDAEVIAVQQADEFRRIVLETLSKMYSKEEK